MPFIKTGSVSTLAVATYEAGQLRKTAQHGNAESGYTSGTRKLDIKAALDVVASEYDLSSDPSDYVFEAIRGNTVNVPNENSDGFHKNELLRFDHRLGKQVYRTYELKPHQINHRAENPKNARGFILDAHYNDSTPPMAECPNCHARTASREGRDVETGIHCIKCGQVVKDEFVELLVAIDRKKDPTFAEGVMSGVLKHGSMGCSCLRTRCNVCNKVAYNRSEFCKHIRNKGREYDESEQGFNPVACVVQFPKGKAAGKPRKVAKAFEWCEGTVFDEYSRVHDPADPKAEQYEILQLQAKVASLESGDRLRHESEILMLQSKVAELERKLSEKLSKAAQKAPPMPGQPPVDPMAAPSATPAAPGAPGALPPPGAEPEPGAAVDGVMPTDPAAPGGGTVNIEIGDIAEGPDVVLDSQNEIEEMPDLSTPIEQMTPESVGATPAGPGQQLSPADMGIMPQAPGAAPGQPQPPTPTPRGASVEGNLLLSALQNLGGPSMLRFASSYKHLKAEITSAGNVRVFDPDGTFFVVKPDRVGQDERVASKQGEDLAKSVLTMIAEVGLGATLKRTNAIAGPRMAQVLEHAVDDMKGVERNNPSSIVADPATDMAESRGEVSNSMTGGGEETDTQSPHSTKSISDSLLPGRETNMEGAESVPAGELSSTKDPQSDTREKRPKSDLGNTVIDDDLTNDAMGHRGEKNEPTRDAAHQSKVHAARLEAIYSKRLADRVTALEKEKAQFEATLTSRLVRAMKLVARRQALNLEYSPMKTAMGIALANPRSLGDGFEYAPMDQRTAVHLVEASFNEPLIEGVETPAWELFIDGLMDRAASVMKMHDEAVMQLEADLKNVHAAAVIVDEPSRPSADQELRRQAQHGNLQLAAAGGERQSAGGENRRDQIRAAMGGTKVAGLVNKR